MGAYRYCDDCQGPQSQLDFDDIKNHAWSDQCKVPCTHCGVDREDDTPENRIRILIEEILAMKEAKSC